MMYNPSSKIREIVCKLCTEVEYNYGMKLDNSIREELYEKYTFLIKLGKATVSKREATENFQKRNNQRMGKQKYYDQRSEFTEFVLRTSMLLDRLVPYPELSHDYIEELESLSLSQYLSRESMLFISFLGSLDEQNAPMPTFLQYPSNKIWEIQTLTLNQRYFKLGSKNGKSFIFIIEDFFLAFIEKPDPKLIVKISGTNCVELDHKIICEYTFAFEEIIGKSLSIQQVYFLARRLVQFKEANWEYSCFAEMEKELICDADPIRFFCDLYISLNSMTFDCLTRCKVEGFTM